MRKNIVITGASSGLGEGMARRFAAKGHDLALCARRTDRLDTLAKELRERHPAITVVTRQLDVNDHGRVFEVFKDFRAELGTVDRVIINAGLGSAEKPVGTGGFEANKLTAETNFIAALAQAEAAMEIFREQDSGHLVVVSSFTALRGLPGNVTVYAASKAGVAALADGIRADTHGTPIKVTLLLPGFIRSEMTADVPNSPLMTSASRGARALVKAIDSERARAYVPSWPYLALVPVIRYSPLALLRKLI